MSLSSPEIDLPGVRIPESEHQETVENIKNELKQANLPHEGVVPVTPTTHLEIDEKTIKVVGPEAQVVKKTDPQLTGFARWWDKFKINFFAWWWGRPRTSDAGDFNKAKLTSVVQKAEKTASGN